MILKYKCENEDCSRYEKIVEIHPDKSAQCEECGWFLTAIW